jgi:hypothetical protein
MEFAPAIDAASCLSLSRVALATLFLMCATGAIWLVRRVSGIYRKAFPILLTSAMLEILNGSSLLDFSHGMFIRSEWWSSIGLQHRLFAEEMTNPGRLCAGRFRRNL